MDVQELSSVLQSSKAARLLARSYFYFQNGGANFVHTEPASALLTLSVMRVLPTFLYREMLISESGFHFNLLSARRSIKERLR